MSVNPAPAWTAVLTENLTTTITLTVMAAGLLVLAYALTRALLRALARTTATATRPLRQAAARADRADLLTYLAASIATTVAILGMWKFFGDVLHIPWYFRLGVFAFVDLAVITSAVRARRSIREHGTAGADGIAVWVLTSLSALFSAMDADTVPEAIFRLAAPLVAAWLWERGMAVERRRNTARNGFSWRLSPERVLVRLGLAEATGRTAGQADTERRLTRLALAAKHARDLEATGAAGWRQRRALARLDTAMHQTVTHTGLAVDPTAQTYLLAQLGALTNATSLLAIDRPAPWQTVALFGTGSLLGSVPVPDSESVPVPDSVPVPAVPDSIDGPGAVPTGGPVSVRAVPDPAPGPAQAPPETAAVARLLRARPQDIARLREAIAAGDLPAQPTSEAVRLHLAIGRGHARAARNALNVTPEPHPSTTAGGEPETATKNPYIDLTPAAEEMTEPLFQEPNSAPSNKEQSSTQPITEGMPSEKDEEIHTYASLIE